jgi:hypothetical protein
VLSAYPRRDVSPADFLCWSALLTCPPQLAGLASSSSLETLKLCPQVPH